MSIEKEADTFLRNTRKAFSDALGVEFDILHKSLGSNLWQSQELEQAYIRLQEAKLWAEEAITKHGVK
jgi:hypothetical protein